MESKFYEDKKMLVFKITDEIDDCSVQKIGRYKFTNMLGGKLEVANLTQSVRKIFEMSGILRLIPVTEL